jgi:hypothetical protein
MRRMLSMRGSQVSRRLVQSMVPLPPVCGAAFIARCPAIIAEKDNPGRRNLTDDRA